VVQRSKEQDRVDAVSKRRQLPSVSNLGSNAWQRRSRFDVAIDDIYYVDLIPIISKPFSMNTGCTANV
jgi:hypothetical protein